MTYPQEGWIAITPLRSIASTYGYRLTSGFNEKGLLDIVVTPWAAGCDDELAVVEALAKYLKQQNFLLIQTGKIESPTRQPNGRIEIPLNPGLPADNVTICMRPGEPKIKDSRVMSGWDYFYGSIAMLVYLYGWVLAPGWNKLWCLLFFPAYYYAVEHLARLAGLL